jgi:outer membrane protein assembly factor BamA
MKRACLVFLLAAGGSVHAQPIAPPIHADPGSCLGVDTTPGALLEPTANDGEDTPIPWSEFRVEGRLLEAPPTVHALLEPSLAQYRTSLTTKTLRDLVKIIAKIGYQLTSHTTHAEKAGLVLVLRLEPLPMVRKVAVEVEQGFFDRPLAEEIRRRMLIRTGSYLPSEDAPRACALVEERSRIEEYLHDEGYADAKVSIPPPRIDAIGARIRVTVDLGTEYKLAPPQVIQPAGFVAVSTSEVAAQFLHERRCLFGVCFGHARFTRTQHLEDLQHLKELFQSRGYPAVRVQSSFDPKTSFDRRTHTVRVTITTDPRRRLDLRFEGIDRESVGDDQLRKHMTFQDSGSTDDLEIADSARSLQTYLQQRGRFDARVTWSRDRLDNFDRVTFHIDDGPTREVRQVQFVCNGKECTKNRRPLDADALSSIVATKVEDLAGDLLGTNVAATSPELAADTDRIREAYRRAGYREAQVTVAVSPIDLPPADRPAPGAAVTAALVEAREGGGLHVRFSIDEGEPTLLGRIELEPGDEDAGQALHGGLCDVLLRELANQLAGTDPSGRARQLGTRVDRERCVATATNLPFREDDVTLTRDRLREFLFKQGRPRAEIEYEARTLGPRLIEGHFKVRTIRERHLGRVVIRGNFKTHSGVILSQLDLRRARRRGAQAAHHRPVRRGQHRPARPQPGVERGQRGRSSGGALRLQGPGRSRGRLFELQWPVRHRSRLAAQHRRLRRRVDAHEHLR